MSQIRNIVFVSYIQDPYRSGNSTDIMTANLLRGMSANGHRITFVAIVDQGCDPGNLERFYGALVDRVICVPGRLNLANETKLTVFSRVIRGTVFPYRYAQLEEVAEICRRSCDLLIAHANPPEAQFFCRRLKQMAPRVAYWQYWSDPFAYGGIHPDRLPVKRWIHYFLERRMLSWPDRVIYGTRTLAMIQKKKFPRFAEKMRYIDVPYSFSDEGSQSGNREYQYFCGYFGLYDSSCRNVFPLYRALKKHPEWKMIIVGSGDSEIVSTDNIELHGRVPQAEIEFFEQNTQVYVVVLNHTCVQIPGKVFYRTGGRSTILVVLDGDYKTDIKEYLEPFQRFEFCDNTEESIEAKLRQLSVSGFNREAWDSQPLSPVQVGQDLVTGGKPC